MLLLSIPSLYDLSKFEKKIKDESVLYKSCYGLIDKIAPDFDHKEIKNSFDKR